MLEVSIIIPVFNSKAYIIPCIDSLLSQTMDNIELLFVDDHGSDGSFQIAQNYLEQYTGQKKIRYFQTDRNSGPGIARNIGIENAEGNYLCFVDSDDVIAPDYCEKLYNCIRSADADLACCDIRIGDSVYHFPNCSNKRSFLTKYITYGVCFMYKRDLIVEKHIEFPGTRSAEDSCFLICAVLASSKMSQIHEPLYTYIIHNESTSRRKNRSRASQRVKSYKQVRDFAKLNGYQQGYRIELAFVLLKKCYLLAIKDLILG